MLVYSVGVDVLQCIHCAISVRDGEDFAFDVCMIVLDENYG